MSAEEEADLADGQLVEVLYVVGVGPGSLVADEGDHEGDGFAEAATVAVFRRYRDFGGGRQDLAGGGEHVEVEEGVAVGFGAREFEGEAAVGRDLRGNDDSAEAFACELR